MNWGENPQDLDLHVLQIDRLKLCNQLRVNSILSIIFARGAFQFIPKTKAACYYRKSGEETCHTYYENKDGCSGLSLDVDNTKGRVLFRY